MKNITVLPILILCAIAAVELASHWGARSPYTYVITDYRTQPTAALDGVPVNWDVPCVESLSRFFSQEQGSPGHGGGVIDRPLYSFWGSALRPFTRSLLGSYVLINAVFITLAVIAMYDLGLGYSGDRTYAFVCALLFVSSLGVVCYGAQPMFYIPAFCFTPLALFLEKRLGLYTEHNARTQVCFFLFLGTGFLIYDMFGPLLYYFLKSLVKEKTHRAVALLFVALAPVLIWHTVVLSGLLNMQLTTSNNMAFRLPTVQYWCVASKGFMTLYEGILKAVVVYAKYLLCAFVLPLLIYAFLGIVSGARRRLVKNMVALFLCLSAPIFFGGPAIWEFNPRRMFMAFWPVVVLAVEGIDSVSGTMAVRMATRKRGPETICILKWAAIALVVFFSNLDLFSNNWRYVNYLFHGDPWR